MMNKPIIFTVGHSTHQLNYFLELLQAYSITCLVDVRSVAASRFNPQYNKRFLSNFLENNKITYMHFAEEFGARRTDRAVLDSDGKVDFEKVKESEIFKKGIERLRRGIEKGFIIALMCSEGEPLDCHRFSMISIALEENGFTVNHILKDKTLMSNEHGQNQLLKMYEKKLLNLGLFRTELSLRNVLRVAYRLKNKQIAYSPNTKQ